MRLQVRGGTSKADEPSLCLSCCHYSEVRDDKNGIWRDCNYIDLRQFPGKQLPARVTYCSSFYKKNVATLQEMKLIAWELKTDGHRRKIGFHAPGSLTQSEKLKRFSDVKDDDF